MQLGAPRAGPGRRLRPRLAERVPRPVRLLGGRHRHLARHGRDRAPAGRRDPRPGRRGARAGRRVPRDAGPRDALGRPVRRGRPLRHDAPLRRGARDARGDPAHARSGRADLHPRGRAPSARARRPRRTSSRRWSGSGRWSRRSTPTTSSRSSSAQGSRTCAGSSRWTSSSTSRGRRGAATGSLERFLPDRLRARALGAGGLAAGVQHHPRGQPGSRRRRERAVLGADRGRRGLGGVRIRTSSPRTLKITNDGRVVLAGRALVPVPEGIGDGRPVHRRAGGRAGWSSSAG